jgi:folate-binding protein YgfZ
MFDAHQYDIVLQGAGLLDLPDRGRIVLHGQDRKTFLHALLTNDIVALGPGTGCYAALLTAQGRMVADMHVFELGDVTLLDVHLRDKDTLLAKLDQLIFSEDVQLGDVSESWTSMSVQGTTSAAVLASTLARAGATAEAIAGMASWIPYQSRRITVGDDTLLTARVDDFGRPGFYVYSTPGLALRLRSALAASGAVAIGRDTAEVLRIEEGRPLFHVDMTEETIPLEAGIESRAISLTKGCYPGQEVVIRILHRGQGRVLRKLTGLTIDDDVVPSPGDGLFTNDKDVGRVTSACRSPAIGKPIALAYVHRDCLATGTEIEVAHGESRLKATVTALPFTD